MQRQDAALNLAKTLDKFRHPENQKLLRKPSGAGSCFVFGGAVYQQNENQVMDDEAHGDVADGNVPERAEAASSAKDGAANYCVEKIKRAENVEDPDGGEGVFLFRPDEYERCEGEEEGDELDGYAAASLC